MINSSDFAARLDTLIEVAPKRIAVALSGGCDSMALTLLTHDWASREGVELHALTVDHRLRAESTDEAKLVHEMMEKRRVLHRILTYKGKVPTSAIEETARKYRYDLLTEYCRENGIVHLLIGHNMDEQAETFFLNLSRGSGLNGLAGMAPIARRDGITLLRPMLNYSKDEIKTYLRSQRQKWVEDPSNSDTKYKRVRVRRMKKLLSDLELTPARLSATMENLSRARAAVEFYSRQLATDAFKKEKDCFTIDPGLFRIAPDEVGLRALSEITKGISGKEYPPRMEILEKLYAAIVHGTLGRGMTLAGFKFFEGAKGIVKVKKEVR